MNLELQRYKLGLEKAEEPEIKLPTSSGSYRSKGIPEKNIYFASLTMRKPMWIPTNWKILKEMGIADYLTCLLRNLYSATVRTRHGTTDWF